MNKVIKKLLIAAMVMFSMVNEVSAQKVWLGLKFSPLLSWNKAESNTISAGKTKFAFNYGLLADFQLAEKYYVGTGLEIAYMGGEIKTPLATQTVGGIPFAASNISYMYQLQYLQIPLTLKFRTKEIGRLAYWAQFGYGNSFLIRAKADIDGNVARKGDGVDVNNGNEGFSFNDNINFYRGSMIIGACIEYPIGGNSRLTTGLRFDNGIFDVLKEKTMNATNSNLSLQMGIYF